MTYQERRSIIEVVSMVCVNLIYAFVLYSRYIEGQPALLEDLKFWGIAVLLLIPISIVSRIVVEIIHAVYHYIRTQEEAPVEEDERDKMINLKASRISQVVFAFGFFGAMIAIALGQPVSVMFIILIVAGMLTEVAENLAKYIYYTRGL